MVTQTVLSSTCAAFDDEFVSGEYYFGTCVPHKTNERHASFDDADFNGNCRLGAFVVMPFGLYLFIALA
ncbi:hypothetical protein ACI65C_011072, partial [Semiaphis heraclei]